MKVKGTLPLPDEDVNFRVGKYGKFEWMKNGEECFIQWMPPSLVDNTWPPESMLAHMDWIGVDVGVLYQAHLYGHLNEYLADCVKRWPDRFIGMAQFEETELYKEPMLQELRHVINDLGLKGLYYNIPKRERVDDEKFDSVWDEVLRLKIPIMWDIGRRPTAKEYLDVISGLERLMKRFPDIPGVVTTMASNLKWPTDPEHLDNPRELANLLSLPNVYYEIGYVLAFDLYEEYPYPQNLKITKAAYEQFGAEKLLWGADMPALMRSCTYRQSLDFVRIHCDFMSEEEKDLVLGGNAARLFNL